MSRRENVPCCIHVAVVYRSAIAASPLPLGQNIAFEEFSRVRIRRLVSIPAVRSVDMAVTAERDKIHRVKPNIRVVGPSFDVMDMQSHPALLAKSAGVVVPTLDMSGNLSELISEYQVVRAHRNIFRKAGATPLLLRPVVRKNFSALASQASAGFRVADNEGSSEHLNGAAAVAAACDARITVLSQHNQAAKSQADDWFLIGKGCRCCHLQEVRAGTPEASA